MELPLDVDALRTVLRDHDVCFARVFGSHAGDSQRSDSDVDLAVWSPRPLDRWPLEGSLPDRVDLVDLRTALSGLAGRVAMTGVVVLDDHPPTRMRWQADTRKRHLDEAVRRDRFRRDFVAAHA